MADENVELLRPVYEEWARGNWRPHPSVYADDMEWGWSDEFPEVSGVWRGEERSDRLRQWLSGWEDWRCEAESYVAEGEVVVALTRYSGRGKVSGAAVDVQGAHVWTFRDRKVVRLIVWSSREAALADAGLQTPT